MCRYSKCSLRLNCIPSPKGVDVYTSQNNKPAAIWPASTPNTERYTSQEVPLGTQVTLPGSLNLCGPPTDLNVASSLNL